MMQYDPGHGDYSKERHEMFDALTLEDVLLGILGPGTDRGDDRAIR